VPPMRLPEGNCVARLLESWIGGRRHAAALASIHHIFFLKVSHALGAAENLRRALFFGHVQNRRQPALHDTILNNVSPRVGDVSPKQPQDLTPLGADQRTGPRDQGGHATVDRRQHGCNKNCDQTCV